MEYVTLNNGIKMPKLGYGVYQLSNEECERCVLDAISAGYRSIDTAQSYGNEEAVGNAINKCGVPREELFITTKVWITNGGYPPRLFFPVYQFLYQLCQIRIFSVQPGKQLQCFLRNSFHICCRFFQTL